MGRYCKPICPSAWSSDFRATTEVLRKAFLLYFSSVSYVEQSPLFLGDILGCGHLAGNLAGQFHSHEGICTFCTMYNILLTFSFSLSLPAHAEIESLSAQGRTVPSVPLSSFCAKLRAFAFTSTTFATTSLTVPALLMKPIALVGWVRIWRRLLSPHKGTSVQKRSKMKA